MTSRISLNPSQWGIATKLSVSLFIIVTAVFSLFTYTLVQNIESLLEDRTTEGINTQITGIINTIDIFDTNMQYEVKILTDVLTANFPGDATLDTSTPMAVGQKKVPILKTGDLVINQNFTALDAFSKTTKTVATVFVKSGSDFIRVSTSVKDEKGNRAVGTALNQTSPAFKALAEGRAFGGTAKLFGRTFTTYYKPIVGKDGTVIGAFFVGRDIVDAVEHLKVRIKALQIGKTGYFYALDANPGEHQGMLMAHPASEGKIILDSKDVDGQEFVKTMVNNEKGIVKYPWINPGETSPRVKLTVYNRAKSWNWVIAGGAYVDEVTAEASILKNKYITFAIVLVLVVSGTFFFVIQRSLIKPLRSIIKVANKLATGDLTAQVRVDRVDEIGEMLRAMNGISEGLTSVVRDVRNGTNTIALSSREIEAGILELSSRTEAQAASLEETAASMEELTSTVKQNADNALEAHNLASNASSLAVRGGAVVSQVIDTMGTINQSSTKIVDIIGVIDNIAFQTNILALNAAVEAARAGEQGRGFAVVATEVRNLAQRSASAAKEIKGLIEDSVNQVKIGSTFVKKAGDTMEEIVASVKKVEIIMQQISLASKEQSSGIEQVNQSVAQMDQMTQQNAALVEESALSAKNMAEQTEQLVASASVFTLK